MNCPRIDCKNKAIHDSVLGVLPCESCQLKDNELDKIETPEFYTLTKAGRIQKQRDEHGKDILQPYALGKNSKPNPSVTPKKLYKQICPQLVLVENLGFA